MRLLVGCLCAGLLTLAVSPVAQGAIGFAVAPGSPVATGTEHATGIALGDINGDGRQDVVTAGHNGAAGQGFVTAFLGNGQGGFAPQTPVATGGTQTLAVALSDMNADGRLDVVTANRGSESVSVLLGDGAGSFAPVGGSPFPAGQNPADLVIDDFNRDRIADVVVTNDQPGANGSVSALLGIGGGVLGTRKATDLDAAGPHPTGIISQDFNFNGQADVVVANRIADGRVTMLQGQGNGTFCGFVFFPACQQTPVIGTGGSNTTGLAVGRINASDAAPDVLASNAGSGSVTALIDSTDGRGILTAGVPVGVGGSPGTPAIGDFDADGRSDALVPLSDGGGAAVLAGDGNGGLSPVPNGPFGVGAANPQDAVIADFNGDEQQDFATVNDNGGAGGSISAVLNTNAADVALEPSAIDFGTLPVGVASATRNVTVRNIGTGFLEFRGVGASGELGGDFPITGGDCFFGRHLAPGETCAVTAAFRPSGLGPRSAGLVIFSNAPSPHRAELRGSGPPAAIPGGAADTTAPVISGVRADPATFAVGKAATAQIAAKKKRKKKPKTKQGTTFRFTLSEGGRMQLAIRRKLAGKRRGGRCVKPSRRLRKARKCTRLETVGALRRAGKPGANAVPFSGRIGRKALKRASYQLEVAGSDDAGNKSAAQTANFRVTAK